MKKVILELGIDTDKNEFTIQDYFNEFDISQMNGIIGVLYNIAHNWQHLMGNKQIELNEKMNKQN